LELTWDCSKPHTQKTKTSEKLVYFSAIQALNLMGRLHLIFKNIMKLFEF
jgi:hypothetical protein